MERDDVDILSHETMFQGYFRIDRYRLRHARFAGGQTDAIVREVFERGHAVGILLYDARADTVGLIEQFRIGAYAAGWQPWMLEVVAGIIEPGETPDQVARREAKEEAGCEVGRLEYVTTYLVSPGGTSESCTVFVGEADTARLAGIHGLEHEGEDIRVAVHAVDDALAMVADGRIANAVTIIALQWLALNRERLRRDWAR